MKPGQKNIYYISGGSEQTLRNSPLLEAYKAKGFEVLILDDEIDDIVFGGYGNYTDRRDEKNLKNYELKAINKTGADEELGNKKDRAAEKEAKPLIDKIKKALGDKVKDVKLSQRLSDSPSCIVTDPGDPTMQMAQMFKAMGDTNVPEIKPILEVNVNHPMVASLKDCQDDERIKDMSIVLLDQALLVQGIPPKDSADFVKCMNKLIKA
jgi:molecular chaperone HtpG